MQHQDLGAQTNDSSPTLEPKLLDGKQVLIVDDLDMIVNVGTALISRLYGGMISGIHDSGFTERQLAAMIIERNPDLIFIDFSLKISTGAQIVKILREHHPQIAIIGLSSEVDSFGDLVDSKVVKPPQWDSEEFRSAIRQALRSRELS